MAADDFPKPKGLFDWLAESFVKLWEGSRIEPAWPCDASRPVFLQAGARCIGSGDKQEVTERSVIVLDGNLGEKEGVKGYCLPNAYMDAYYVAGSSKSIRSDLEKLKLSRSDGGTPKSLSRSDIGKVLQAFRLELSVNYQVPAVGSGVNGPVQAEIQNSKLYPLIRPRFAPCLPLPSDKGEWRCISSGATWQALLSLTKAFGSARPPLVLVTGPPGSGKEAYARGVHFGQRRAVNDALKTISLAELDVAGLRSQLAEALPKLQQEKGTLFFDEVDKPSADVRSSLLRTLEARTYTNPRRKEEYSCDDVTFVCAAGKQLSDLRSLVPADFWTRMEIHVPVHDPLLAASQVDRKELLASFFKFFWWDFTSSWAESLLVKRKRNEGWKEYFDRHVNGRKLAESVFRIAIGTWHDDSLKFETCTAIDHVAEHLASVLAPHLERRQLSTRGLRSVVISVLSGSRSELLAAAVNAEDEIGKKKRLKSFENAATRAIHDAIGTVLQVLPG